MKIPGRALILECIGDDTIQMFRYLSDALKQGDRIPRGPYVALICSTAGHIRREYLRGQKDYTNANSIGSRGVTLTYWLENGRVYEVHRRLSWSRTIMTFCRVDAGRFVPMTREDVDAWLSDPSERTYSLLPENA